MSTETLKRKLVFEGFPNVFRRKGFGLLAEEIRCVCQNCTLYVQRTVFEKLFFFRNYRKISVFGIEWNVLNLLLENSTKGCQKGFLCVWKAIRKEIIWKGYKFMCFSFLSERRLVKDFRRTFQNCIWHIHRNI